MTNFFLSPGTRVAVRIQYSVVYFDTLQLQEKRTLIFADERQIHLCFKLEIHSIRGDSHTRRTPQLLATRRDVTFAFNNHLRFPVQMFSSISSKDFAFIDPKAKTESSPTGFRTTATKVISRFPMAEPLTPDERLRTILNKTESDPPLIVPSLATDKAAEASARLDSAWCERQRAEVERRTAREAKEREGGVERGEGLGSFWRCLARRRRAERLFEDG